MFSFCVGCKYIIGKHKSIDFWSLRKTKLCKELNSRTSEKTLFTLCWSCLLNCSNTEKLWHPGVERPTFIPTLLLCWLTLAVTSLPSVFARRRNRLVNLRANLILSPHPPHFHASTLFRCLDSSHVHLSICPLRHPLAKVWTKLADDTA